MARAELDIINGFYQSASKPLLNKRLINVYPVVPDSPAFSQKALLGTDGMLEFVETSLGGVSRGTITADGRLYYVIGTKFVEFFADGTFIVRGPHDIEGTSNVSMAYNTQVIFIVNPDGDAGSFNNGYFYNPAVELITRFTAATFQSFAPVRTVSFKDPYLVFTNDEVFFNGGSFNVNLGLTFDELDFGSANISPDGIVAGHTNHNFFYVCGTDSIQVFRTIQTNQFPFQFIEGAIVQLGCDARLSIKDFNDGFIMIGSEKDQLPAVWYIRDSNKVRISTPGIEQIIHTYSAADISDAVVDTYAQDGAVFASITIGDNTMVYDATATKKLGTPTWHERQSGITDGITFKRWRAQHIIKAFGKIFTGDAQGSVVSQLDPDTFFELTERIERVVQSQPFNIEGTPIFSHEQELFIDSGVGNSDSTDPEWLFKYSDDLGRTWSNRIARAMGKVGEYTQRLIWSRMGRIPFARVVHFKTDDPVRIAVYKLEAEAEAV